MVRVDKIGSKKFQTDVWDIDNVHLPIIRKIDDYFINQWDCGEILFNNIPGWWNVTAETSIDGDVQTVWFTCIHVSTIAELSPTDLSMLRRLDYGIEYTYHFSQVGGDSNTILIYCYRKIQSPPLPTEIIELETTDFSILRNAGFTVTYGLAADNTGIWSSYIDQGIRYIREHSYSDFSLVRSVAVDYAGVLGGQSDGIWMLCTYIEDEDVHQAIMRLSPTDFSVIKRCKDKVPPNYTISGVGGNAESLYVTGWPGTGPFPYVGKRETKRLPERSI